MHSNQPKRQNDEQDDAFLAAMKAREERKARETLTGVPEPTPKKVVTEPSTPVASTHVAAQTEEVDLEEYCKVLLGEACRDAGSLLSPDIFSASIALLQKDEIAFEKLAIDLRSRRVSSTQVWYKKVKQKTQEIKLHLAIAQSGKETLSDGTEKTVAEHVMQSLEQEIPNKFYETDIERPPLKYTKDRLWRYDMPNKGIWTALHELEDVSQEVYKRHGALVVTVDEKGIPKKTPLNVTSRFVSGTIQTIKALRSDSAWFEDDTDRNLTGITFADCFVTLDGNGKIIKEPHSPDQRSRTRLPFDYLGQEVMPRRFLEFLDSIFRDDKDRAEKIELVRQIIGTCLLGRATKLNIVFFFIGSGANGKTTLCNIIRQLFPGNLLCSVSPNDMKDRTYLVGLETAKLNLVWDMEADEVTKPADVKRLAGGDPFFFRPIYEQARELKSRSGHVFVLNALPMTTDWTDGFFRRWMILTFNREFKEHEQNKNLASDIVANELPEIAAWCIDGAAAVVRNENRYVRLISSESAVHEWRHESDAISEFIREACRVLAKDENHASWSQASDLLRKYAVWGETFGYKKMGHKKFGDRLKQLGFTKIRRESGWFYPIQYVGPGKGAGTLEPQVH